jgi:hypothetical protein
MQGVDVLRLFMDVSRRHKLVIKWCGKDDHAVRLDLGFMRELGEIVKESSLRVIFGVQEKLFDNPNFSFVPQSLDRVKERFEQVLIGKKDIAFVVSERLLQKTAEQKATIREHLQTSTNLYSNMSERLEEFVGLFPIHPAFIEVFEKVYFIRNRSILKNISAIIREIMPNDVPEDAPGIFSFDHYWKFIKDSKSTDPNIKEVVEKSGQLEAIITRSFPKKQYKPLALKIINALSVHRLTTGDIQLRAGLTSENLRGYLFLGTPESRPTAQPPEDYYVYFVPPYGNTSYTDDKKRDEVFFIFKDNEEFKNNLRLYAAALLQNGQADDNNKAAYRSKADVFRKRLTKYLSENKNTCFEVVCDGTKKQPAEVLKGNYRPEYPLRQGGILPSAR